jgi:hypothetical protein
MEFSPSHTVLAVTRESSKPETTFYEIAGGKALGRVEGEGARFDPTSKYVAARGGLATLDGKYLWKNPDGFKPRRTAHPMEGDDLGSDAVGRGWWSGKAFFSTEQSVVVVDPATKATTTIAASCTQKLSSYADGEHGLMIAACTDVVLVTDLEKRTTTRVKAKIQAPDRALRPPAIEASAKTDEILISGDDGPVLVQRGTARLRNLRYDDDSTKAERQLYEKAGARDVRRDGRYRATAGLGGLRVVELETKRAIIDYDRDWEVRYGAMPTTPKIASTPCGAAKESDWTPEIQTDGYVGFVDGKTVCVCTAARCLKTKMTGGRWERVLDVREDGTVIASDGGPVPDRETEPWLGLYRPGKQARRVKMDCPSAAFAGEAPWRVLTMCRVGERYAAYELSGLDLSLVAKREIPPITDNDNRLELKDGHLVLQGIGGFSNVLTLPLDWVKDPALGEISIQYRNKDWNLLMHPDGRFEVEGNREAAAKVIACWDGETLRPWSTCR